MMPEHGDKPDVRWRQKIGSRAGSLTVSANVVLVGTNNDSPRDRRALGDRGVVMCFARQTGRFLWQATHKRLSSRQQDVPGQEIGSVSAVHEERAYYVSNRGELMCVDLHGFSDGENDGPYTAEESDGLEDADIVWALDMVDELGVFKRDASDIGNPTCSPLVSGEIVYCITGNGSRFGYPDRLGGKYVPSPDAPSFVAVEKRSGRVVWASSVPGKDIFYGQWSSPVLARVARDARVFFPAGDGWLYAFDRLSGRLVWKVDCNDPGATGWSATTRGTRNFFVARPVVRDEMAYVGLNQDLETPSAVRRPVYCIDLRGTGDATDRAVAWKFDASDFDGTFGAVAVSAETVYVLSQSGVLLGLQRSSGKETWRADLGARASQFGSPCLYRGKLFAATEDDLFVFLDRDKSCQARYTFGDRIEGTPVPVGDSVYITTANHVWAIRLRE